MAKVIHTIKGNRYWYNHYRVGNRVVCKYLGPVDSSKRSGSSGATRLVNAPQISSFRNKNGECITPHPRYESQEEMDNYIRQSYVRGGLGIKRIQTMFAEIDLYPSRREVENYLRHDLDIELRTKAKSPKVLTAKEIRTAEARDAFAAAQNDIEVQKTEANLASKEQQIADMKSSAQKDAEKLAHLLSKLRNYRDTGRAPTDAEIEELIG